MCCGNEPLCCGLVSHQLLHSFNVALSTGEPTRREAHRLRVIYFTLIA